MNFNDNFPDTQLHEVAKNFDIVLGGNGFLPEQKGLHVRAREIHDHGREYIEISFPRMGGKFGDAWNKYAAGEFGHECVQKAQEHLVDDFTSEEKDRSMSLTLVLKEENLLSKTDEIEYVLVNEHVSEDCWLIEEGPRVTIKIPRCHVNEEHVEKVASQREVLENAEDLIREIAKASGIAEEEIRGYKVEGITPDHPMLVAGLSCDLNRGADKSVKALRVTLKEAGLALEEFFWGSEDEDGAYILRLEDPYDESLLDKLSELANRNVVLQ